MTPQPDPWRDQAVRVIEAVIKRVGTTDRPALAAAISAAYPFGERRRFPYLVWRSEVAKHLAAVEQGRFDPRPPAVVQQSLFDTEQP
jgi:hypothetical protein